MNMENCYQCGNKFVKTGCGTGYGVDKNNNKICYECCGKNDIENLKNGSLNVGLYYSNGKITNWINNLVINPYRHKTGKHNIAGIRHDVWFTCGNKKYHGIQYGYNSEILHYKQVKEF